MFSKAEPVPHFTTYTDADFPSALKWQVLAFMRVQWPSIFTGERQFVTDTYSPELDPVHFVAAEGELLISYARPFAWILHKGPLYVDKPW
jgi:hypothetical protein